jgi:hypothetical protein
MTQKEFGTRMDGSPYSDEPLATVVAPSAYFELLAALVALVEAVELCDNNTDQGVDSYCEEMNTARAVIAKAETR